MSEEHMQEPVAILIPTYDGNSYQSLNGHMPSEVTLLYTVPPDASARIDELEKQRDMLLAALEKQQLDIVCECKNCMNAHAAIASVKEQA